MSIDPLECCRLCSSTKTLLSMFGGKSRSRIIRNSLRKMVQETVNIQIEPSDSIALAVCFNCLVDISNFYYFKLHCLQNQEKMKNIESGFSKPKKLKMQHLPLQVIDSPDIDLTMEILDWLSSKRPIEFEDKDLPKTLEYKQTQTFQECNDASSQCDIVDTVSSESQTNEIEHKSKSTYSRTRSRDNNDTKDISSKTNINNHKHLKVKTKNVVNSYAQTEPKILSQKLFVNSMVHDITTQNSGIQTEVVDVVDKDLQCDLVQNGHLFKTGSDNNNSGQTGNIVTCQTIGSKHLDLPDPSTVASVSTQCDIPYMLNSSHDKISHFLSPTYSYSSEIDTKQNFKMCFKEEKLSPQESLTIATSPKKFNPMSPNTSDLLQIKTNKSHSVQICKICDKSLYNKRQVVSHNRTHMQCQFCKKKFRSLTNAQIHVSSCNLKEVNNVSNSLPFISLVKIEQVSGVKNQYPTAFDMC